jgi:hypothetical protein
MKHVENSKNTEKVEKPSVKKVDPGENKLMRLFYDVDEPKKLKIWKEEENLEAFYKPID